MIDFNSPHYLYSDSHSESDSSSESVVEPDQDYLDQIETREKDCKDVLLELNLSPKETNKMMQKLEDYLVVDDIDSILDGCFIRWIDLRNQRNLDLKRGAFYCHVGNDGTTLVCKSITNRYFHISFEHSLVFQKIDKQYQEMHTLLVNK